MKKYHVYIMTNNFRGTLYIGVTSHLVKRIFEHKNNVADGFTSKYGLHTLVYIEEFGDVREALSREKQLKSWRRKWKIELI